MAAIASRIFLVASLQKEAGLFIASLLQVVEQGWRRIPRQRARKFINSRKQRHQIWLWIGCGHRLDLLLQLDQRPKQLFFGIVHGLTNNSIWRSDQDDPAVAQRLAHSILKFKATIAERVRCLNFARGAPTRLSDWQARVGTEMGAPRVSRGARCLQARR